MSYSGPSISADPYRDRAGGVRTCMLTKRSTDRLPIATLAFSIKSWRAFQLALDPLARPSSLPVPRRVPESMALSHAFFVALADG